MILYYISISQDGELAGEGVVIEQVDGTLAVANCPACLGPSKGQDLADDVESAYRGIDNAINRGDLEVSVDGVTYTWDLLPHESEEY